MMFRRRWHVLKWYFVLTAVGLFIVVLFEVLAFTSLSSSQANENNALDLLQKVSRSNTDSEMMTLLLDRFIQRLIPIVLFNEELLIGIDKGTLSSLHLLHYYPVTFLVYHELFGESHIKDGIFEGFQYTVINSSDPGNNSLTLPTRYFVGWKERIAVELVVFHFRRDKYWWHGSSPSSNLNDIRKVFTGVKQEELFNDRQGAYDKFDLTTLNVAGSTISWPVDVDAFVDQMKTSQFIPCNYTRANVFYSRYNLDNSLEARNFRKAALNILATAKLLLDELGVRFWLSSGTCLGYFRQCDIIPYSKDVDIGIWITDYTPRIVESFLLNHFLPKHKLGKENDSLEFSFYLSGVKLDIFFFYEETDYMWNGGVQTKSGKKFKYIFPKFQLCWTEFFDLKVRVPCDTQTYIEANYGLNWFVPVVNWDWKTSPSNVHENGYWPKEQWPEVMREYGVDS